ASLLQVVICADFPPQPSANTRNAASAAAKVARTTIFVIVPPLAIIQDSSRPTATCAPQGPRARRHEKRPQKRGRRSLGDASEPPPAPNARRGLVTRRRIVVA